ncbi:MFS transporter [Streptantibioticus cattleyicolor]|uniref:Major facilitator superfamily MFS_1 n=1 Tax=Streptantibioticus cattleyicolor (strain ATCC 35852 / DSM 46488 / JCM 4925 / NBRC 14057 / NRRL 8057) TaxID=1003195 RepID=F8JK87_STREN|nr:MFS transporter [Streptantibioticus cattleyicolor]AEW98552.1 major facilitator superfamily MFS_1 [Streptantibioticus cattleyicolor NRRL 8057 = DSM 46488]CCB72390.1 Inner membrane transport protein ydhP [Streptantibioticus cattleyicolor NRRL 8057 = DSM 46488]
MRTTRNPSTQPRQRPGASWALTVLTVCAFTLGTGEIMIAGLLPRMASDTGVSLATAGLLVSAFALTVVVGGPVLALTCGRVRRRRLVAACMACYAVGNVVSAVAPSYLPLALGRVLAALAHSALMPLFFGLAADVVPAHRRGSAVARVSLGFALAMIAGLPIGTALGQWLGWRATFWAVALLTVAVAVPLAALTPDAPGGEESGSRGELRVLGDRRVRMVTAVTALAAAAAFTAYTYVTPLLTDTAGFRPSAVTVLLLLFGVGGTVGNLVGGKLTDRSVLGGVCAGLAALAGSLLLLGMTAHVPAAAVVCLFGFGAAYYAVIPAVNTRMLDVASGRARTLALTVQSSAFNLGTALGGWLGGRVIAVGAGLRWLPLAGGVVALAALALAAGEAAGERRRSSRGQVCRDRKVTNAM